MGKDLKLYRKNGGFEQALADFKSLGPDHVQSNNYEMFGRHGKNEIYLRDSRSMKERVPKYEAFLTVTIRQTLKNKPYLVTKTIPIWWVKLDVLSDILKDMNC